MMKSITKTVRIAGLTSRRVSHFIWIATLSGIAMLLVAVALFQYRWNMQIKQAAELGVGAKLESVVMKWHLNLYREFSTICIALEVGPDSGANARWDDYLRRYEEWRHATTASGFVENLYSNPDVVRDVYIYETSRRADDRLLRLNTDADRIERSTKPPELKVLLARLLGRSANLRVALRAWELDRSPQTIRSDDSLSSPGQQLRPNVITGWQFDESIPAIVHPILHHPHSNPSQEEPVDWLVVVLNRDTIQGKLLPELAQRYFADGQEMEYKLAVVAVGKTSRLLYSSDPGFRTPDVGTSDSVMNIFGPPPESTEESFWQVIKSRESLRGEEWRSFSAPVWFPVIEHEPETEHWVLFLKHRIGAVDASITRAWYANLFAGAAVLLLLGTSMFLVLIATRRLRGLAAMQMDFVASISHELRTPLAAILAAGQNLTDGFAPDRSHYGSLITTQARQLVDLVDQILLFTAMKDGKKKYQLTAVTINDVMDGLRKTTLTILAADGFDVELRIDEDLPPVLADRQALVRCLRNLIENAVKYSGESRWIGISAELEEPGNPQAGIRTTVADHGVGITPSELPHICEPFYRGSRAIAAQIHGSGLGLSVVTHIVNEMHGRLSVSSRVGEGSSFVLHLQVAEYSIVRKSNDPQEVLTFR
jgi:signal transduction histidine kinase